jgi:NitT/TauT family transport system substrate-binding protein
MIRLLALLLLVAAIPARAESGHLNLGVQRGMSYLPWIVMQHEKFAEEQAKAMGVADLNVSFQVFSGAGAMNDALLSGAIDVASTGVPGYLTLWAKGRGKNAVIGLASYGWFGASLVTRNPAVKKLEDFSDKDRIAVPSVKTSFQAIMLRMAAARIYGYENVDHFDAWTVTRGHPDAVAAFMGKTEINSHFSIMPYTDTELTFPGAHVVATSAEIAGEPMSNGTTYLTQAYVQANPKTVEALYKAMARSVALINTDPARAAADYLAVSGEKTTAAEIEAMIRRPETIYDLAPHGIVGMAHFLFKTGMIAAEPKDWKELYLPYVHGEKGS